MAHNRTEVTVFDYKYLGNTIEDNATLKKKQIKLIGVSCIQTSCYDQLAPLVCAEMENFVPKLESF